MPEPKVFIFLDNSNIFISAKQIAEDRDGLTMGQAVRIKFDNLIHLAHADRPIGKALAVGATLPEMRLVWERLHAMGVETRLSEHGHMTRKEQGVDAALQVEMLRSLADNAEPQIAVLLTGDGAGYDDGIGFHADLARMADKGWGIEVIAWNASCKRALKEWATSTGVFIPLEDYYDSVTFIEGTRWARPLNLTHRAKAAPPDYDPAKERRREKAKERSRKNNLASQKKKKQKQPA